MPERHDSRPALRVLLVEDDPLNLEIARQTLEDEGIEVVPAIDARSAVAAAQGARYDLILMDLQLPDFDGWEATRRIRRQPAHDPRTRIVALTGTLHEGDRERCREAGMDGCEEKPLTPEMIHHLLAGRLAPASAPGESASHLSPEALARPFLDSGARLIAELQRARENDDRAGIAHAAHTLKSVAAHVGAMRLSDACGALEAWARDATAPLADAIEHVLTAYDALARELGAASGEAPAPLPAASTGAPLVLVVDDEENERFLVRRMLEAAGYRIVECDSGAAALERCRCDHPQAVLLDGLMPGMDGVATCRALRRDPSLAAIPVLMYSGLADPAWRQRAAQAGADCFVDKSVGIADLQRNLLEGLAACGVVPVTR